MSLKKFYWKSLGTFIILNLSLIQSEAQEQSQIDPVPDVIPPSAFNTTNTTSDSKPNVNPNPTPSLSPIGSTNTALNSNTNTNPYSTPNTNSSTDPSTNLGSTQSPSLQANQPLSIGSTSTTFPSKSANPTSRANLSGTSNASMNPNLQPATTQQVLELSEKIKSIEARMVTMSEKINQTFEAKLATLSEKLTSTQASLNEVMRQNSIPTAEVFSSPADSVGKPVAQSSIRLDSQDPELGYIQNEGMEKLRDALILFQSKKYPESVLRFSDFISRNPDHLLAGTAQYYIGNAYLQQKEYQLALDELQKVVRSYSKSTHISDALKDIATVQGYLKKEKEMTRTEQALNSTFPQSPAAKTSSLESPIASNSTSLESTPAESEKTKNSTSSTRSTPPTMIASSGVTAPSSAPERSSQLTAQRDKRLPSQTASTQNPKTTNQTTVSAGAQSTPSSSQIASQASSNLMKSEIKKPLTLSPNSPQTTTKTQSTPPMSRVNVPTAPIYSSSTGGMN